LFLALVSSLRTVLLPTVAEMPVLAKATTEHFERVATLVFELLPPSLC
jgi:hypothetical protein